MLNYIHEHTHPLIYTFTHIICAYTYLHACTLMSAHIHTKIRAHTHARTHTRTHIHTRTHTRAHVYILQLESLPSKDYGNLETIPRCDDMLFLARVIKISMCCKIFPLIVLP